jgi:hypothetical protein
MKLDDIMDKLITPLRKPVTVNEGSLRVRIARGDAAKDLQVNDTFKSLVSEVEDFYLNAWRASTVEETALREKCHVAVKILDDMRGALISRARDGETARETLTKHQKSRKTTISE